MFNDLRKWQRLEIFANKIAIKKAKSPEEFEACATHIEKNDYGDFISDSDEWAEQVRIKAYGIDWYFNKYINSPEFENFLYLKLQVHLLYLDILQYLKHKYLV